MSPCTLPSNRYEESRRGQEGESRGEGRRDQEGEIRSEQPLSHKHTRTHEHASARLYLVT